MGLASLLLAITFFTSGGLFLERRGGTAAPPFPSSALPRLTPGALESLSDSQAGKEQPKRAAMLGFTGFFFFPYIIVFFS